MSSSALGQPGEAKVNHHLFRNIWHVTAAGTREESEKKKVVLVLSENVGLLQGNRQSLCRQVRYSGNFTTLPTHLLTMIFFFIEKNVIRHVIFIMV